ncbi:MAG TPA: hypothetical protein VFL76_09755 [Edaphocola sp.]|nr:hypothetical protein [Edaphocola sp.]
MGQIGTNAILAIGLLFGTAGCTTSHKLSAKVENHQELSVTGEITAIENGKDGYVATVKDDRGKLYYVTVSFVNLQKGGGEYKTHKSGDVITVKGAQWTDTEGKMHITAYLLK